MKANWVCPAVTALTNDGHIDLEGNAALYEFLIKGGIDGILILGSIGEFFAVSLEDKKALIDKAIEVVNHRVKLYVGTASMHFEECVELSNYAIDKGADAAVVVSPFYFKLPVDSILNFYDTLAERVHGPIMLYNFPERTIHDISAQMILELKRRHSNIIGIKDTTGAMGHTREIIDLVKGEFPDFIVYSGFDEFFGHNVLSGGDGCIASLSNFAPEITSEFVKAARNDDIHAFAACQKKIDALMEVYAVNEQFIPAVKEAVIQVGVPIQPVCGMPLKYINDTQKDRIHDILVKSDVI